MAVPGNDLLTEFENQGGAAAKLGIFLRRYVLPSIGKTAQSSGVAATGPIPPPASPESVNVTTSGELMQVVIHHTAPVIRGQRYFTEVATNQAFVGSMIHDHGASRAPLPIYLPTKDTSGATHNYYVASYVQYPGGPPSKPTYFGGGAPTAVNMGGTTQMDLQAGTGSGTASNGAQTFEGLGKAPIRH